MNFIKHNFKWIPWLVDTLLRLAQQSVVLAGIVHRSWGRYFPRKPQRRQSDCDVQAFAAPFARYPGYVISATRARDQHVIVIVLTRASPTDSRLVHKLLHTLTTQPHQNYAKYHQKHPMAEDSSQPSSFFDMVNNKKSKKRLEVKEMMMMQWMCGVTKGDQIRSKHVRG